MCRHRHTYHICMHTHAHTSRHHIKHICSSHARTPAHHCAQEIKKKYATLIGSQLQLSCSCTMYQQRHRHRQPEEASKKDAPPKVHRRNVARAA